MAEITTFPTVSAILEDYGTRLILELSKNLETPWRRRSGLVYNSVATGKLKSSIDFRTVIFGSLYSFELYMEDYWKWVDKGRPKGNAPPIKAILNWLTARRFGHYVYGYGKNPGRSKKSIIATNYQAQKQLAYGIAVAIEKHGTEGSHFFSNCFLPGHSGDVQALEQEFLESLGLDIKVSLEIQ